MCRVPKTPGRCYQFNPPRCKPLRSTASALEVLNITLRIIKSAALDVLDSGLRDADGLTRLFMLLDCAYLIALVLGMMLVKAGQQTRLDWHGDRGLSFLQLGLRELARLYYERLPLLQALPKCNPHARLRFSVQTRRLGLPY